MDEGLNYHTNGQAPNPFLALPGTVQVNSTDERDLPTLVRVQKEFEGAIAALYKDFNAFDLAKDATTREAAEKLLRVIAGKQEAYDILSPLLLTVQTAIRSVNDKYKE